jgi:hypothetical protein
MKTLRILWIAWVIYAIGAVLLIGCAAPRKAPWWNEEPDGPDIEPVRGQYPAVDE